MCSPVPLIRVALARSAGLKPAMPPATSAPVDTKFAKARTKTSRIIPVRKKLSIALTLLALIGVAPMLGACHTTAGAGEDLKATGNAITNSADKHTP